ncbi:UNVERIFIED_CONTAM: hypothetical protein FKN15_067225 [Acipenser sinensis]
MYRDRVESYTEVLQQHQARYAQSPLGQQLLQRQSEREQIEQRIETYDDEIEQRERALQTLRAQLTRKRRWELLAWQQAQALTLAPAQLLTPALELTPPAPGVTPDVTELDVSIAEEDHDAISIVVSWKMAASLRSSPYLP